MTGKKMPQRYRVASCGQYLLNGFACVNLRPSRSVGIATANRPRQFQSSLRRNCRTQSGHRISEPKLWRFSAFSKSVRADAIKAP